MSKQKCLKCGKSYQRLPQHMAMAHEGKSIGASSNSTDGQLGGALARNINPKSGLLPDDYGGTRSAPQPPATFGVWDENGDPTHCLRSSGLRVVRKIGDSRRYDIRGPI